MKQRSVFADEWRECLRAHYMHVVRIGDISTEPTLISVMQEAGFSETELAELRIRATMHVDDVGADFQPDAAVVEMIKSQMEASPAAEIMETAPEVVAAEPGEAENEADMPPAEEEPPPNEEYYAPPDDSPHQLSLF
ncbi:MAG: hypothetical protein KJ065_03565 [Anaerolineae bacterium]|nr:hypothetical protein [Anaerolineae bacterium]